MMTNGTLDTRLSQNLVKEFDIPTNKEYDKFNPFKIGGGNAIWITHIPPNVKVWFSTDQNFDNAQRLDYMNRGMRYLKIGEQGITRLYDNFFIFTEGILEDDFVKICVSTQGEDVEPILSSNTNQIDQVDAVGKIGTIQTLQTLQTLQDISDNVLNKLEKKPTLIQEIDIFQNSFISFKNNSVYKGEGANIFTFNDFKFKDGTTLTQEYIGKKLFFKMSLLKIGRGNIDTKPVSIRTSLFYTTYTDGSNEYRIYDLFYKSMDIGERAEIEVTIPIKKEIWTSGGNTLEFLIISNNASPASIFLIFFEGGIIN